MTTSNYRYQSSMLSKDLISNVMCSEIKNLNENVEGDTDSDSEHSASLCQSCAAHNLQLSHYINRG